MRFIPPLYNTLVFGDSYSLKLTLTLNRSFKLGERTHHLQLPVAQADVEVAKPVGRIARVLDYLINQDGGEDISAKDVEKAVGFELRRYKDQLINNWDIMMAGYGYVAGTRGSGKSATFKWIGKQKFVSDCILRIIT